MSNPLKLGYLPPHAWLRNAVHQAVEHIAAAHRAVQGITLMAESPLMAASSNYAGAHNLGREQECEMYRELEQLITLQNEIHDQLRAYICKIDPKVEVRA